jgi:Tfp pilus assembly protein PilN
MDLLNTVMQWIVAPVAAVVYMIYNKQQEHHTDIAVLKSQSELHKQNHDREMKEMREITKAIFAKLDRIEEVLRERK